MWIGLCRQGTHSSSYNHHNSRVSRLNTGIRRSFGCLVFAFTHTTLRGDNGLHVAHNHFSNGL